MKLLSRPINWTLVLVPLLVSMLAFPGNAYSRESDRTVRQLEHRQRVSGVERPRRKSESATPAPRARPSGPTAVPTPDVGNRGPVQRQEAVQRRPIGDARARNRQQTRNPTGSRPSSVAESLTRAQRSRVQSDARSGRQRDGAHTVPPARRVTTARQTGQAVASPSPRRPLAQHDRRTVDRARSDPPYRQASRNPGYEGGNRGHGSQPRHARQPDRHHEQRIRHDQQRANRYYAAQARQREIAMQRTRTLQQQRRANQYRYQNQYNQRLRQQHVSWNSGRYNYYNDPYYSTPASYRYQFGGQWQSTNRYGANLMQQAVDYGYQEGVRAGQADRHDGWRADYRDNYAYQDAGYGYNGRYISPGEYQHYFRQGFQRGYQDGYGNRYDYGYRRDDGSYAIIAAVLATIVGLQLLN